MYRSSSSYLCQCTVSRPPTSPLDLTQVLRNKSWPPITSKSHQQVEKADQNLMVFRAVEGIWWPSSLIILPGRSLISIWKLNISSLRSTWDTAADVLTHGLFLTQTIITSIWRSHDLPDPQCCSRIQKFDLLTDLLMMVKSDFHWWTLKKKILLLGQFLCKTTQHSDVMKRHFSGSKLVIGIYQTSFNDALI